MTDRITTTCQHSHTVTLRLNEGEWCVRRDWFQHYVAVRKTTSKAIEARVEGYGWVEPHTDPPPAIRAELEAALAAAEASCGGCGCAERLRAEAERRAKKMGARRAGKTITYGLMNAANFLDAAPDARGSDLRAERTACGCGHGWEYHGPEVPGCAECRCRRVMEATDG